jgi:hypothetical protein
LARTSGEHDMMYLRLAGQFVVIAAFGFFFFWIVAVSGIYLFIFFDTGIERAYATNVENHADQYV